MLSRPVLFLWLSADIESENRRIRFGFPLPIYPLLMFADMADDLSALLRAATCGYFRRDSPHSGAAMVCRGVELAKELMRTLVWRTGPACLADVDCVRNGRRIKFKCRLI